MVGMNNTQNPTICPKCETSNEDDRSYCASCCVVFSTITPEALARKAAHREKMLAKTAKSEAFMNETFARLLAEKQGNR